MESSITQIEDEIYILLLRYVRRSTAQDLAFAQWRYLRDENVEACVTQLLGSAVQRGVELDRAHHSDRAPGFEVAFDGCEEVLDVDLDVDEYVERLYLRHVYWYQTAVSIVDEDVAAECASGVVVYAASAVRDIAHDQRFGARAELGQDVGDCGREEEEALRHLEGDLLRARCSYTMDCLVDFEVVVLW